MTRGGAVRSFLLGGAWGGEDGTPPPRPRPGRCGSITSSWPVPSHQNPSRKRVRRRIRRALGGQTARTAGWSAETGMAHGTCETWRGWALVRLDGAWQMTRDAACARTRTAHGTMPHALYVHSGGATRAGRLTAPHMLCDGRPLHSGAMGWGGWAGTGMAHAKLIQAGGQAMAPYTGGWAGAGGVVVGYRTGHAHPRDGWHA